MSSIRSAALVAAVVLSAGCARPSDPFVDALPGAEALTLEVTGDASEGAGAQKAGDGALTSAVTARPEWLGLAQDGVRRVNDTVRAMLGRVRAFMDANEPTELEDGVRRYGPADVDGVTYRLFVRRLEEDAFGWRLEAKPVGADDGAYLRVMAGAVRHPDEATRRGVFGVNLDHLKTVKEDAPGQGVLVAGFSSTELGKTLAYRLERFTPDLAAHPPVSAIFVGHRRADTGATATRLAIRRNFLPIPDGTALPELVRIRARWQPGLGGHSGLLVTHGDVPEGDAYLGRACWNAQLEEGFKVLRHCTGMNTGSPPTCEVLNSEGDPSTCRFQEQAPGMDPMQGGLEEGAPDPSVIIPLQEPTGDALP